MAAAKKAAAKKSPAKKAAPRKTAAKKAASPKKAEASPDASVTASAPKEIAEVGYFGVVPEPKAQDAPVEETPADVGYFGIVPDKTPNENYTVSGVLAGKPTPETKKPK